jgi:hypothetical protein
VTVVAVLARNVLEFVVLRPRQACIHPARAAINRGDTASAWSMVQAFISQVQANSGKKIDPSYAAADRLG